MAVLTVTDARDVLRRAQNDTYPGESSLSRFSEVKLHGKVMNGSYEHQFIITVQYVPDTSDPNPLFPNDSGGYPGIPLDPTKEYTIDFTEEA